MISATTWSTVGALIGLFLGSMGIYGVLSYMATLRIPEIGIRLAVGAQPIDVWMAIMSRAMTLAALGIAVGVTLVIMLGGLLESLLYDVRLLEPGILAGVATLIMVVAAASSALPARRAARTTPGIALTTL